MFIGLRRSITVQVIPRCPRLQRTSPPPPALLARRFYMSDSTSDPAALSAAIDAQGAKVRQLKADKAPKEDIDAAVSELLALKANISGPSQASGSAPSKKAKSAAPATYTLKTPKGTKDWDPLSMRLRSHIFSTITRVFEAHGAVTIDTPVFELKEILSGKYGEDSKLIYDLQDQGGELCSLRYDLTVPFARFVAMNPSEYGTIKRYHIAKVYRRDQPAMSKGRFREFYQCDFDIAGLYDPMIPDSEILVITVEILQALQMPDFKIKLNHRKILDGIFSLCGVPEASIRPISSAVDKLDKSPWSAVRAEMVDEKGLAGDVADKIGEYVKLSGGRELLQRLEADEAFQANKTAVEGLKDMAILFDYLDNFGIAQHIVFDLSLARGLDYYTGIIYEAVTSLSAPPGFAAGATDASAPSDGAAKKAKAKKDAEGEVPLDESTVGVGSIAAGGRYDHLVGMFSGSKKPDVVPCVGISIGVERVFAILMQRLKDRAARGEKGVRPKRTEVFVMSVGDGMVKERMGIAKMMWDAGVRAEFLYKARPKPQAQFAAVDRDGTPLAVLLAPEEWKDGSVRVKVQRGKDSEEGASKGEVVKVGDLVKHVKERLEEMLVAGDEGTGF